jgi:regulator of replication initiation timing
MQLMLDHLDPNDIQDLEQARQAIIQILNLVEELVAAMSALREENQRLRDENNRLKGEQGKPTMKPGRKPRSSQASDHSSEPERRCRKKRTRRSKVNSIPIDREEKLHLDRAQLPDDAEFKGYEPVIVQDVRLTTDNIRFLKEKCYSPSQRRTYLAELPAGYKGEFGPGVRAFTIVLYHMVNTSEPKIVEFFEHIGVQISSGQVSNLLIKEQDPFHDEKDAVYEAGLRSSPWHHMDDTGTRVNGVNQHCQVVCAPLYTMYCTTEKKDRLTALDVLTNFRPRSYLLNDETYTWLQQIGMAERVIEQLRQLPQDQTLNEEQFTSLVAKYGLALGVQQQSRVWEAAAVTAYHAQQEWPVVELLLTDDAPQFKRLTADQGLCWVHDARHYNKLAPSVAYHRKLHTQFMKRYWTFYGQLLAHRLDPTSENAAQLESEFDELFSTQTGYVGLDRRIEMTRAKKQPLLAVLRHPEIPLHNNPAEIEMRHRVRKRDVSFGPRTEDGKRAWDTFATLAATTKKLGVSFYCYIHDRISGANHIPYLADLIEQRAQQLHLGASWVAA